MPEGEVPSHRAEPFEQRRARPLPGGRHCGAQARRPRPGHDHVKILPMRYFPFIQITVHPGRLPTGLLYHEPV